MSRRTDLRRSRKKRRNIWLIASLFLIVILVAAAILIYFYLPYFQEAKVNPTAELQIYHMGELMAEKGYQDEGTLYLPFSYIKRQIDPEIFWDEGSGYVIITTDRDVFHLPQGDYEGMLNLEPYNFTYPTRKVNNEVYLATDPLADYYEIDIRYVEEQSIFLVHDLTVPLLEGKVLKSTKLRSAPEHNVPYYAVLAEGTNVNILRETEGWYWVESACGFVGYLDKKHVKITDIKLEQHEKSAYAPWNPIGEPIKLLWEYVNKYARTDINKIGKLDGVQVVSPTWFSLQKDGLVANIADKRYVDWAHQRGYQVWGLFSNSFDAGLTSTMLRDSELRMKVIKQILSYVDLYELDGVNIDFENIYLKDKDYFVLFVRELTPLLHEKKRTVSLDLTFHSLSENWSMFYDRKRLGEVVDYMVVMGYDQYPAGSTEAGPVAAIPWVEKGIKNLLAEVACDKIILGVPLYTRMWEERVDENGKLTATSKTFTMDATTEWLKANKLTPVYDSKTQLNYAELKQKDVTYRIWIEDLSSMNQRIELMEKYNLAGMAAWRRGFEDANFWKAIAND